jgi:hypothetical protein
MEEHLFLYGKLQIRLPIPTRYINHRVLCFDLIAYINAGMLLQEYQLIQNIFCHVFLWNSFIVKCIDDISDTSGGHVGLTCLPSWKFCLLA